MPVVVGEIIAYRGWRLKSNYRLRSLVSVRVWEPHVPMTGDLENIFDPFISRVIFQRSAIRGGVYAWKHKDSALTYNMENPFTIIGGTVALYGDIVLHSYGYRAQYAAISSLDYIFTSSPFVRRKRDDVLDKLRKRYLCPTA